MSFLSEDELSDIRTEFSESLPGTCIVKHAIKSSDGMGGEILDYSEGGTEYPCRLQVDNNTGKQEIYGNRSHDVLPYTVVLPYTAEISKTDRIHVNGLVLEVVAVGKNTEGLTLPAYCKEVS